MKIGKKFNGLKEDLGNSISYMYVATDVPENVDGDDTELRELILASLPPYENNIKLTNIQIVEQLNNTSWVVTAEYKTGNKNFNNQSSMTFDTGGSTIHKTQSIKRLFFQSDLIAGNLIGSPAPIGFNGEDVEGVDILLPIYAFSETHPLPDSVVTNEYQQNLFALSATVNNADFRGFKKGEVLFKGASGSKNGNEKWILTFNFEAIPNQTNIVISEAPDFAVTIPAKEGWDYISIRYSKKLADGNKAIIPAIHTVEVNQVYYSADFSLLGIGVQTWDEVVSQNQQNDQSTLLPFGA